MEGQRIQYTELWRECNAMYEEWAGRRGFSYSELLVILALDGAEEACTQKDICAYLQMPKQTVNSILKILVERGWVTLNPTEEDRRSKEIILTADGKRETGRIAGELFACEDEVWRRLGNREAKILVQTTRRYNQLFREVGLE